MELLAATNNAHKLAEMQRILEPVGICLVSLQDAGVACDPEESGTTFAENALIKARAVRDLTGRATVADDSGLCVDTLNGAPGVYSARYAGGHGDAAANNEKLLKELAGLPAEKRGARFVCAVAVALPDGRELCVEGASAEGTIAEAPAGENGFGYDPLFVVEGRTFAQCDDGEKDAISHRRAALEKLRGALPGFVKG